MAGIQKAKREEAARKLLEAAVACVAEQGIDALHVREIARRAGYSVGSVYKYYADLDEILIAVNTITLGRIKAVVGEAIIGKDDPMDRLKALARAYHSFALENRKLWEALFGHRLPDDRPIPEIHLKENAALLAVIGQSLLELSPKMSAEQLEARKRTCFAAVHGLVLINLENRFVGLSGEVFMREMDFLVERLATATV
ncbi:MAG: TetR/AcrR family transcriptional regulator [Pseudomonadota bacterium]